MTERKRRTSALAGLTPVTTQVNQETESQESPALTSATAPASGRLAGPVAATAAKKGSKKMNYYADEDQQGRIRAAFYAGRDAYGWRSLTDMQLEAVMQRVEALEQQLNNGQPFDPVPAGSLPVGRPLE